MNFELILACCPSALKLEACEKLTTKRLLSYFKRKRYLRSVMQCECCGEILAYDDEDLSRKEATHKALNEYMDSIKSILDSREHVS